MIQTTEPTLEEMGQAAAEWLGFEIKHCPTDDGTNGFQYYESLTDKPFNPPCNIFPWKPWEDRNQMYLLLDKANTSPQEIFESGVFKINKLSNAIGDLSTPKGWYCDPIRILLTHCEQIFRAWYDTFIDGKEGK